MYCIVAISLSFVSITFSYSLAASSPSSSCLLQIAQQKNQTQTLELEKKAVAFALSNSPDFKSLNQYSVTWLATNYDWNTDFSACTTTLNGIVVTFELSNSSTPFAGLTHVTMDPQVTKIIGTKTDLPNVLVPPTCTDKACRTAHGIFY